MALSGPILLLWCQFNKNNPMMHSLFCIFIEVCATINKMQMDHSFLPQGNYYCIINRASNKALTVAQPDAQNHKLSKIIGAPKNCHDNNQIFMFEKIKPNTDEYEIISCLSDYVLTQNGSEVELDTGKQSKNQLYRITQSHKDQNESYYSIRVNSSEAHSLALEGNLRVVSFDPYSHSQQFRLEKAQNITINNSCIFVNNFSGKVIDVPEASEKPGERLIIWDRNNRWNQRWYFQSFQNGYLIRNVATGLCLDIAGQSKDSGAKIVQWNPTNGSNQIWSIETAGDKVFRIRSQHASNLLLGVRKQEKQNGSYIQVTDTNNRTCIWRIEGHVPGF